MTASDPVLNWPLYRICRTAMSKNHVPTKIVTLKVRRGDGEHVNPGLFQEGEKSEQGWAL